MGFLVCVSNDDKILKFVKNKKMTINQSALKIDTRIELRIEKYLGWSVYNVIELLQRKALYK